MMSASGTIHDHSREPRTIPRTTLAPAPSPKKKVNTVLAVVAALSLSIVPVSSAHAAFPGFDAKIVYEDRRGQFDSALFVMQSDGSGVTQITSGKGSNLSPSWSADGTKIAFVRVLNNGNAFLEVANADGSGRKVITSAPFIHDVAWSPNSSLAFSAPGRAPGSTDVFRIRVDGTRLRNMTKETQPFWQDSQPAWSPDGRRIAFTRGIGGSRRISTMFPNGKIRKIVVRGGTMNSFPNWSNNGTQIVFQRHTNAGPSTDIFIVNADGTGLENLTRTRTRYEWTPVFSPGGDMILFSREQGRGTRRPNDLWSMNLDGTARTQVTNTPVTNEYDADWGARPI
jgi:TolB protein